MSSLRSLVAVACLFAMTGCAVESAPEQPDPSNAPAAETKADGEDTSDTAQKDPSAASATEETGGIKPMKKQIICKKGQDC